MSARTAKVLPLDFPRYRLHDLDRFIPSCVGVGLGPGCGLDDYHVALGIDVNRLAVDAERGKRPVVIVEQPPLISIAKILMIVRCRWVAAAGPFPEARLTP